MPKLKKDVIEIESIDDRNIKILKENFPNAISTDEEGKFIIDPIKLQMYIDPSKAEIKENGYSLSWVGKKESYHNAFTKNYKILKPLKNEKESKNWDTTDNILIKGDNIEALKILKQNYFEKIKMVYIDPPYNTKNEAFVYNDNFTTNTEDTLEALGYDKEYIDYIDNIKGAKTHSGWLTFMYPRLLLARDLLKEDGVIFISIDDNEVSQLRLMCDEIFGEENFVESFIWRRRKTQANLTKFVAPVHDYILCYCKNKDILKINKIPYSKEFINKTFKNPDKDPKGSYQTGPLARPANSSNKEYELTMPNGRIISAKWSCSQDTFNRYVKEKRLVIPRNGEGMPRIKIYLSELKGQIPNSWLDNIASNDDASREIETLFGSNAYFSFPKPTKLIIFLLQLASNKNDTILDFFAGSGTTAQAVMDLNKEDNGKRKFILVQWAEETPKNSKAKEFGYDTIYDICAERVRRAGEKIKDELKSQDKTLFDDEKEMLDTGFRAFEVVEDKKQVIYQKNLNEITQDELDIFIEPEKEDMDTILYNLLIAENLILSTKIETIIEDCLYRADNVLFILKSLDIDKLADILKEIKNIEHITVYAPLVTSDKFTLELESIVNQLGYDTDKLKFRG